MIHKVFHHIARRAVSRSRFFDQATRRLHLTPRVQDVFSSSSIWRICSYPGSYTFNKNREKCRLQDCAESKHFPLIIPALYYSLEGHNKPKAVNEKPDECPKKNDDASTIEQEDGQNLTLFKRFKKMYRDYWYVLVPVHVITSLGWFVGFYYLAESGVDIVSLAEMIGVSEYVPEILKDSSAGYFAIAYALYKIATPVRYMVTIGGTTVSINYLRNWGYIKPIPPKAKLKEMYEEKKENLKERRQHFADELKNKKKKLKECRQTLMRERREQPQKKGT